MLQLFNNIILIIHYLGFVVLAALFFCFKATRPLIYQSLVASCYPEEKEEPAGNYILSFSDLLLALLYPFIWRNKLYPIDFTSTVWPLHKGTEKEVFWRLSQHGFVSRRAQPWESRSETGSPFPFFLPSCLLCWIAQIPFQKAQFFPYESRSILWSLGDIRSQSSSVHTLMYIETV